MSSDVTDVWQHNFVTLFLTLVLKIEDGEENPKENENRKEKKNKLSLLFSSLTTHRYLGQAKVSQISYSLVVILELNGVSEVFQRFSIRR